MYRIRQPAAHGTFLKLLLTLHNSGIGKAWIGLSSGILTQLYTSFVGTPSNAPETLDFLLLLAAACLVAAAGPATLVVLHPPRPRERGLRIRFGVLSFAVWVTAALVTASALLSTELSASGRHMFGIAIVAAILTPVFVTCEWTACGGDTSGLAACAGESIKAKVAAKGSKHYEVLPGEESNDSDRSPKKEPELELESVYAQQLRLLHGTERGHDEGGVETVGGNSCASDTGQPELSTTQVVQTVDCWLLGLGAVCLWGGGQMVSVNVNQMCESLGYGQPVRCCFPFQRVPWRSTNRFRLPGLPRTTKRGRY
jgi:hypothetical protein